MASPRVVLRSLRQRASLTHKELAAEVGMPYTTYAKYESERYDTLRLPWSLVAKLIPALVGRGSPSITVDQILEISEVKDLKAVASSMGWGPLVRQITTDNRLAIRWTVSPEVLVNIASKLRRGQGWSHMLAIDGLGAGEQFVVEDLDGLQYLAQEPTSDAVPQPGNTVVLAVPHKSTGFYSIRIAVASRIVGEDAEAVTLDAKGSAVTGKVVGICRGVWTPL
jgi:DNA-binding XRE family transcriptional regulator